jgi:hypothetical protein
MLHISGIMKRAAVIVIVIVLGAARQSAAQSLRFHAQGEARVHLVVRDSVRNANGSPRITDSLRWLFLTERIAPLVDSFARDERLGIDPGYLFALLVKESAGDSLAVSAAPALGLAQLTARTDADLQLMTREWPVEWMGAEVRAWPRSPFVHDGSPAKARIDSLLREGRLTSRAEYLFAPATATRAAAFWVRLLELKWTIDYWPGGYGAFARSKLNGGRALSESQLIDLVTVSYNRGYIRVHDLVAKYGAGWKGHLDELGADGAEARDYLERVRAYTALFEGLPAPR